MKTVEAYIQKVPQWRDELRILCDLVLQTDLKETIKWGAPSYGLDGHNLIGVNGFKSYFGLWFHQGALLSDPAGVLINAQVGKTTAMRQWRMYHMDDINPKMIQQYLDETLAHCRAGRRVKIPPKRPVAMPQILRDALDRDAIAHDMFARLSQSHRREYIDYITEAKRDATQVKRLDKTLTLIKSGAGLHDQYR